jgi:orotate phosphoribosyltransferase
MTTRDELIVLLKERAHHVENGVACSGGETTTTYLDVPGALGDGEGLDLASNVLFAHLEEHGLLPDITMVVGPMTGSIPLVVGLPMVINRTLVVGAALKWAIMRDEVKEHGLGRMFVGAEPGPGDKVILTDDVVSSGRSLMVTLGVVQATGAQVLAVVPLVDRGDAGTQHFKKIGIPYLPVLTYADLGLAPLGA